MSQVSKYPVSKDVSDRMFEVFQMTISSLNNKEDIEEFFDEFLSPIEKIMLAKRLSIAVLLVKVMWSSELPKQSADQHHFQKLPHYWH